jgi:hypothetical protein
LTQTGTNLPYTFYDRYTTAPNLTRTIDRRQPLPSTFAARYIQGGAGAFATNYKIWREGTNVTGCANFALNGTIAIGEFVRFDEHENPFTFGTGITCSPCGTSQVTLPETSATNTADSHYPTLGGTDVGGWMYLNLNNGAVGSNYSVTGHPSNSITTAPNATPFGNPRASQNWVVIEMFGNVNGNRLSVDFDAAWLGNGCSAAAGLSSAVPIGPAGGVFVCPPGVNNVPPQVLMTNGTTTECTGTNTTPVQP